MMVQSSSSLICRYTGSAYYRMCLTLVVAILFVGIIPQPLEVSLPMCQGEVIVEEDERNGIITTIAFEGTTPSSCNENNDNDDRYEIGVTKSSWNVDVSVDTTRVEQFKVEYAINPGPGFDLIQGIQRSPVNTADDPLELSEGFTYTEEGLKTRIWSITVFAIDPDDGTEYNIMELSRTEQVLVEENSCIDAYETTSPTYAPFPTAAPITSGVDDAGKPFFVLVASMSAIAVLHVCQ